MHVTKKATNLSFQIKFTVIKLIHFPVKKTVQKLKSTGKVGVGYVEVSCHLQGSPRAGPTLIITDIVITKIIKNEDWKWGGKELGKGTGWDRAGELTSDLWPGKAEGVKSKPN